MSESVNLVGLARQLVDAELIDEDKARDAIQRAKRDRIPLVTWLVQHKLVKSRVLMELAAEQFGVAYFDLNAINADVFPKELVSDKLALRHRVLPLFKRGNKLYVAISDRAISRQSLIFNSVLASPLSPYWWKTIAWARH